MVRYYSNHLSACHIHRHYGIIHLPLAIIAGAIAGGIWGFLPGLLKARFEVHEVIVTIMMNYIALYTANAIIRSYLLVPGERTENIQASASLESPMLQALTERELLF